jgi:TfoX/Sxy family transcriptional regulator of competence genes
MAATATKSEILELEALLAAAARGLPDVTAKKMFGCHAFWVRGNVFALVWKHGRLGFKLPEESAYAALMKAKGTEPWKAGPMRMAHWVLVPAAWHGKPAELKAWAKRAHALCAKLEKKTKPVAKTKKAKAKK